MAEIWTREFCGAFFKMFHQDPEQQSWDPTTYRKEKNTKINSVNGCQWLPDHVLIVFLLLGSRGRVGWMVDPTPEGKLHLVFFSFSVEIQFWISTPVCTGLNKKTQTPWGICSFLPFCGDWVARQFDRCSSGLANPTSGSPDTRGGPVPWMGRGDDRWGFPRIYLVKVSK